MHPLAATAVLGALRPRCAAAARRTRAVQERLYFFAGARRVSLASFYHTQRLPEKWTVVPDSLSIMPDRDALLIDIVNAEIEHAHNVAMLGNRYASAAAPALGVRESARFSRRCRTCTW
jgi:hypothetical protein